MDQLHEKYENLNIRKIIKEYEEIPLNNEIIIHLKKELSENRNHYIRFLYL